MRLSELEQTSGVPAATIKYYLREGLLPPGRPVSARLAEYDETHVRRLRLLKVLREVGDVPVSRLQRLVRAVESEATSHEVLGVAADLLSPTPPPPGPRRDEARDLARRLVEDAGWEVRPDATDRENLAAALERLLEHVESGPLDLGFLRPYVEVADRVAAHEIGYLDETRGRTPLVEQMVLGQVVFGTVLSALRRLAEEHHSGRRFGSR